VILMMAWLPGTRDRLRLDRSAVREVLGSGRWVMLSSIMYVLANNGDRLLLGLWVDARTLGLYSIALSLATMADMAAAKLFSDVAMPVLSEVARTDRARLRQVYLKIRRPIDAAFLLSSGLLCALGPLIVNLLYRSTYADAGAMLQILALSLVLSRYGINGSVYLAVGEPKNLSWVNFARLLSLALVLPASFAQWGLQGALLAVALFAAPSLVLMFMFNARLGLNDWGYELRALLAWPVGFTLGWVVRWAA
jgi:O-antigen/teichoic acid export membrane protein